jgi:hypothetical protein
MGDSNKGNENSARYEKQSLIFLGTLWSIKVVYNEHACFEFFGKVNSLAGGYTTHVN